jgi:hypothetical protein
MSSKKNQIVLASVILLGIAAFSCFSLGFASWTYPTLQETETSMTNGTAVAGNWSYAATVKDVVITPSSTTDPNYGNGGYYTSNGKLISDTAYTMTFSVDSSSGTATLTSLTNYNNSAYSVVLPSSITDSDGNVYPVTDLEGDGVGNIFRGQTSSTNYGASVHQITLPSTLTKIGDGVFKDCVSLSSITFPSSLTTLGVSSFNGSQLTSVSLVGTKVTEIPTYCFANCSTCQTVTLLGSAVTAIDDYAFYNCNMGTVSLPASLQSIGKYALYGGWWAYSGATYGAAASAFASVSLGAHWAKTTTVTIKGSDNNTYSATVSA